MLYLSPSWGAAGLFLAGAGLGASISRPTKAFGLVRQKMSVQVHQSFATGGLPMERILAWLGAWALALSFFFSSSPLLSFTSLSGTLPSSFFFFFFSVGKSSQSILRRYSTLQAAPSKRENVSIPAGLLALLDTLWERMVAIQPSTSTDANFLNSKTGMRFLHRVQTH